MDSLWSKKINVTEFPGVLMLNNSCSKLFKFVGSLDITTWVDSSNTQLLLILLIDISSSLPQKVAQVSCNSKFFLISKNTVFK